ncbi:1-acylglycerone phosphate reductase [Microdochium nivale]|nr:1-acylglycerone phosphate reductase [Microdochium nivale]
MAAAAARRKTVLITGCTDGTAGAALARQFHRRGLRVFATARKLENMRALAAMGIETLQLDVTDGTQIRAVVEAVREKLDDNMEKDNGGGGSSRSGRLDILVNNAGYWNLMPLADQGFDEARRMFEINYFGLLAVTQAFLPLLLPSSSFDTTTTKGAEAGGIIANVGSISALVPPPYQGVYASTKAAVAALSDVLRLELAPLGVRVVHIRAGGVASRFLEVESWKLPETSMYAGLAGLIECREHMGADMTARVMAPDEYARGVVADLLSGGGGAPPREIRRGSFVSVLMLAVGVGLRWMVERMLVRQSKVNTVRTPAKQVS